MSDQPINSAALRGAVDLSGLSKRPAHGGAAGAPAGGAAGVGGAPPASGGASGSGSGLVVDVPDAQAFSDLVNASMRFPVIITLFAGSQPASKAPADELAAVVRAQAGRVQLGVVDIDQVPEVAQAFQQLGQQLAQGGQLPAGSMVTTVAFLQGQPMPLPPLQDAAAAKQIIEEILKVSVANGLAGRVPGDHDAADGVDDAAEGDEEEAPSPHHDAAYEAFEKGDFDGAISAYDQALAENPNDLEAHYGRGQAVLYQRTQGLDATEVRAGAAANPSDVTLATQVADLDLVGGHVEDAFGRLIDTVKLTAGDERTQAREHLLGLFEIVGASDERVRKARTALMSALY
ncbi:co-chaperone YbbN [Demetria terragena]|uniref:co-chaperone YbbN n=1 Tax=Demetria terragena TaxID=63959 RepID=UPI000361C1A4|nr:co-chaperone YbbN [Demetria terragena]